jgi:UDP-N-acetylmuramoylalanine--D-glutamate ligase
VNWKGKKVLVLGLGETGLSMANWLARHGALVSVADSRTEPPGKQDIARKLPSAAVHLGGFPDSLFHGVDLIAISPGVRTSEPAVARAAALGIPVAGVRGSPRSRGQTARPR